MECREEEIVIEHSTKYGGALVPLIVNVSYNKVLGVLFEL